MGSQRRSMETIQNMARISTCQQRAAVAITDAATVEVIIGTNNHAIEIQNSGDSDVYFGGSDVTSSNGRVLYSGDTKIFTNVENTFSIYFVVAAGETSELRIVEFK